METLFGLVVIIACIWAIVDMYDIMATHGGKNGNDIYVGRVCPFWWIMGFLFLTVPVVVAYLVARNNFLR